MQTVRILCVGKLKESYWQAACAEYAKRLSKFCRFSIEEIPEYRLPEEPSQAEIKKALQMEGEKLLSLAQNDAVIAMAIEGRTMGSPGLSSYIENLAVGGKGAVSFVIGSSFGLSEQVKTQAVLRLSMSPMTFPHQLARVMLCEQIYRAFQISGNGKYHK